MSLPNGDSYDYDGPSIYPQAIALSTLACISLLLTLPQVVVHVKAGNFALTMLVLSISIVNIQNTINPIIWPDDNIPNWYSGTIFCDIEAKLQIGLTASIPASATCICRQLARTVSPDRASIIPSASVRLHRMIFDLLLCVALPIYLMAIHILVQPYRYYIYGIVGCVASVHSSWVSIVTILIWPIFTSFLGTVYVILVVLRLLRHKREVTSMLANAQISRARFNRMFIVAAISVSTYTPLAIYGLVTSSAYNNIGDWAWMDVHPPEWNQLILKKKSDGIVFIDRWLQVLSGFFVFVALGLGDDAMVVYRRWANSMGLAALWNHIQGGKWHGRGNHSNLEQPHVAVRERRVLGSMEAWGFASDDLDDAELTVPSIELGSCNTPNVDEVATSKVDL